MTYVIGLSGPPRSGKDTIGGMLAAVIEDAYGVQPQLLALSLPMRHSVYALMGDIYCERHYEQHKDDPQEIFDGATIRQAMIKLSEDWVKPSYGKGFWAKAGINRMWAPAPPVLIITDLGFDVEAEVLDTHFGADKVLYGLVDRPGTDFTKDSRDYVKRRGRTLTVINRGEHLDQIKGCADRIIERLVERGWFPQAPVDVR